MNHLKIIYNAIDKADSLIFYCDPKGKILMCNKKFKDVVGISKDSIVGSNCFSVIYKRSKNSLSKEQIFKAMFNDTLKYKRPVSFEILIPDCKVKNRLICWRISPILTKNKNLQGLLFIGNDNTSREEKEASLKNIDQTLKNIILNIKEYALYSINLDGNITYYSMGAEDMFGWKRSEIIFKHISTLHSYDDTSYKLPFILEQVKKTGRYELETYFINKDGQSFPVNLAITKFIDSAGNTTGYIFMAKDITERKKLEYQIFQSEKLATMGQLVAGIAHEINNPVFVISGRAEILLNTKGLNKKLRSGLKVINLQVDQIRKLVDRFLAFSRKSTPTTRELDINKIIRSVLPLLRYHKLPSNKIKINKIFAKNIPKVKGDSHQLQEVFVNLFINAYQAMKEGGTLTIKTINKSNEYLLIYVSDTGCGIPPLALKNLFLPFYSSKREGTGLGLSICYNIIKNHSGSITVKSQAGKGTTFIIKLPFVKKGDINGLQNIGC